jgi:3-hydroxyisobutyrate dehydrogenase-like beta-hydroxyacid dehydrogenase
VSTASSRFDSLPRLTNDARGQQENPPMQASQPALRPIAAIGFIGLGVMGEPMCGHLARRGGKPVLAHDVREEPLRRLAEQGVTAASTAEIAARADLILLSLPDGKAVQSVIATLEPNLQAGQCVVDTSTSGVAMTREIGARLSARGIGFADAPVARTREAASKGELSIMVGADDAVFAHVLPVLQTMGTDVTHCGPVGCGQVVKILNNMLVFQNTAALAEAIAIGRRNGVPADVLLPAVALGSGDSFVLRSHGMKSMLPRVFPERAFSTRYAMKDLSYALEMADAAGLEVPGARLAMQRLRETEQQGHGDEYHPVVLTVIDPL